ncbi:MAG TPA: hypothetical protein EYQ64_04205 [Gemmatimonadetes bacterium]|nr:hypothetical protein [Gemmatimonadota bacterium]
MKSEEDHPFILSTKSQAALTKVYRWRAVGGLLLFLAGLAAVGRNTHGPLRVTPGTHLEYRLPN